MSEKKLWAAILAVAALAAFGTAPASADEFTAEKYPVQLTGKTDPNSVDQLTTTVGASACTDVTYTGTATGSSTSVTVTPSLSGCTAWGFPGTFDVNGCDYVFNVKGATSTEGDVDIVCPSGQELTFTAASAGTTKCTVHIPAQADIGGSVIYTNVGSGGTREVTVQANLTGIDYSHTKGTGLGACTSGSATTGTLSAKIIVTGEEDPGSSHVSIFLS